MEPELGFMERVSELSGQNVRRCYYCLRCSAGCPAAYAMDYTPAQILRLVQLGQKTALLQSSAIWLCIGCETCGTRCPNEIHAGAVIDALTGEPLPAASNTDLVVAQAQRPGGAPLVVSLPGERLLQQPLFNHIHVFSERDRGRLPVVVR